MPYVVGKRAGVRVRRGVIHLSQAQAAFECFTGFAGITQAQLRQPGAGDLGACAVRQDVDLARIGIRGQQLDQLGECRNRGARSADVTEIAAHAFTGRPHEGQHDRVTPGEMLELCRLSDGAVYGLVGAMHVDDQVLVAALRECAIDFIEIGLRCR